MRVVERRTPLNATESLADAVSRFGVTLKAKFSGEAAVGALEDQLHAPLEQLIADLATLLFFR
jgi:hypothetical protein